LTFSDNKRTRSYLILCKRKSMKSIVIKMMSLWRSGTARSLLSESTRNFPEKKRELFDKKEEYHWGVTIK
jgi:hypothetical protein